MACLRARERLIDKWEVRTRSEDGGINILPDVAASIRSKVQEMGT